MTTRAKWIGRIVAAVAVAGALALVELAFRWPVRLATWGQDGRRAAEPSAQPNRFEVPVERRSPAHVVVAGIASAVGLASWRGPRTAPVDVLLDTGTSLPLLTAEGARLLRPATADRLELEMHGFAGHRVKVVPLAEAERLQLTLPARTGAGPIVTPVWHALRDSMPGVHVVVPPTQLAPQNGAILLDLPRSHLVVCESVESCQQGARWTLLANEPCETSPELVAVEATVDGHPVRLMLDTGGFTVLSADFYARAGLSAKESARSTGTLVGAGDSPIDAKRVLGSYQLRLGVGTPVLRSLSHVWVVQAREQAGPLRCFPDGAIGLDVLGDCEILIGDPTPRRAYIRCPG